MALWKTNVRFRQASRSRGRRAGRTPPAISCLGAFQTPAVSGRREVLIQASENLHKSGREQLQ
jgi:hypothetical protein